MKLDILAFGAHPDDVELGCAGALLVEKGHGKKTGIIDLTRGELGTRGNPKTRNEEAERSARILRVDIRENLGMADGFFKNDEENKIKIIKVLRKYRPEIILCSAPEDRHPDHARSSALINEAAFLSGLQKIETTDEEKNIQETWRPNYLFNYIQDTYLTPALVFDISNVFDKKIEAIEAFSTQFYNTGASDKEPQTYISSPEFLESVINRSKMFGRLIGVKYAEGFISKKMIGIKSFEALIQKNT